MELIYEAGGGFIHDADEWLPATLTALEPSEGNYGPSIKWVFILDEDIQNGEARESWAWSAQKVTTKNKTGQWIRAIDPGVFPDVGKPIDLSKLLNKRVDVMFERTVKDDGSDGEKIVKVRASKVPAPDPAESTKPFKANDTEATQQSSGDDLF